MEYSIACDLIISNLKKKTLLDYDLFIASDQL